MWSKTKTVLRWTWKVYIVFIIAVIYPLATVLWWVDPVWFGPYFGRVVAAWLTFMLFIVYRDYWRKWKNRGR